MSSLILAILTGFLAILVPGFFISLGLLRKTKFNMFEVVVIGFILGMILPPMAVWLESYLIPYSSFFSFTASLYNINVVVITLIGLVLSFQQGAFDGLLHKTPSVKPAEQPKVIRELEADYKKRVVELRGVISKLGTDIKIIKEHQKEEEDLARRHEEELQLLADAGPEEKGKVLASHREQEKRLYEEHEREERSLITSSAGAKPKQQKTQWIWALVLLLMVISFTTRFANIGVAPKYFEFDPYFDMISTQYIVTYGYQLLYDHSAWPAVVNGTNHRAEPLMPYLEAYWYEIANPQPQTSLAGVVSLNPSTITNTPPNTNLMSLVSSYYPPLVAALLVFVVFVFLYHLYGDVPAIIGAVLATAMPILITTFIAGEQLLEPFGIFALFFFYASYLIAVENPKNSRYAILTGIAFVSNFLGGQYYTVPAGILAVYILLQGLFNVIKGKPMYDFYRMNIIILVVAGILFALYMPYAATLQNRIPSYFGIPIIISLPIASLVLVGVFQEVPLLLKRFEAIKKVDTRTYLTFLVVFLILLAVAVAFTPLGDPLQKYIALSEHFTTPSTPLFMTVQEYAPTGLDFNFGANGFGIIGASVGGMAILVWIVLAAFITLEIYAIFFKNSQTGIFVIALVAPLAAAGMSEVKYLPHFGVAYILAIGVIFGELLIYAKKMNNDTLRYFLLGLGIVIILVESLQSIGFGVLPGAFSSCSSIVSSGNVIGDDLFCNLVPTYWLQATAWMRQNVGPNAPRILSWWDYGDWINWFGNSNAVLRGDNSVPQEDYNTAAHYVLGSQDGYGPNSLASYMNSIQAKYVLYDDQLVPKWGALDFLACVDTNQTSKAYAIQQGQSHNTSFVLGTSPCETSHDPAILILPTTLSVQDYCTFSNSSTTAVTGAIVLGDQILNQTYCVPTSFLQTGNATALLTPNGTKTNIVVSAQLYQGPLNGNQYLSFVLIYLPNANGIITDAPSQFYNSTYYQGYFLGKLPGFTLAYPHNFTGVNYINTTSKIMIFSLNNYTGTLPTVVQKPSYVTNNYSMPG